MKRRSRVRTIGWVIAVALLGAPAPNDVEASTSCTDCMQETQANNCCSGSCRSCAGCNQCCAQQKVNTPSWGLAGWQTVHLAFQKCKGDCITDGPC